MSLLRRRRAPQPAPKPRDPSSPPPRSPAAPTPAPGPEEAVPVGSGGRSWEDALVSGDFARSLRGERFPAEEPPTAPAAPQAIVLASTAPEVDHADGRGKPGIEDSGSWGQESTEAPVRGAPRQPSNDGKGDATDGGAPTPAALARLDDVRPHFGPKQVLEYVLSDVAASTKVAYARDVELFAKWLGTTTEAAVGLFIGRGRGAANALAVDWLNTMREENLSSATRARRLATLSALVRAARRLEIIEWTIDVKRPKVTKYQDTRGPTRKEALKMLAACDLSTLEGLRNFALLLVVLTLGLRRHEVARMRTGDFSNGRLSVLGKGNKLRSVEVPVETQQAIDRWLAAWLAMKPESSDDVVFRSLAQATYGEALGSKGVYDVVAAIGASVGVHAWPHGLRHTAITVGLEEMDGNIADVATFSRHDDPKVTMRYNDNRRDAASIVAAKLGKVFGS